MNKIRKMKTKNTFEFFSSNNQDLFHQISEFLDFQIFLKKIKCLSKSFNLVIKKKLLISREEINWCLQNIDINYFTWQLQKIKEANNNINSIRFFHDMGNVFLEKLYQYFPSISNLNICYCFHIKNMDILLKFHNLEILNIKGFTFYTSDCPLFKIIYDLFKNHSLKKVIVSRILRKSIGFILSEVNILNKDLFEYL